MQGRMDIIGDWMTGRFQVPGRLQIQVLHYYFFNDIISKNRYKSMLIGTVSKIQYKRWIAGFYFKNIAHYNICHASVYYSMHFLWASSYKQHNNTTTHFVFPEEFEEWQLLPVRILWTPSWYSHSLILFHLWTIYYVCIFYTKKVKRKRVFYVHTFLYFIGSSIWWCWRFDMAHSSQSGWLLADDWELRLWLFLSVLLRLWWWWWSTHTRASIFPSFHSISISIHPNFGASSSEKSWARAEDKASTEDVRFSGCCWRTHIFIIDLLPPPPPHDSVTQ